MTKLLKNNFGRATTNMLIMPEYLESKFVLEVFRESGISKWIASQNFDLIGPTYSYEI